jgi:hypothetical protein
MPAAPEGNLLVSVEVYPTGDDVLAGGIDHFFGAGLKVAEGPISGCDYRGNGLAVDDHVGLLAAGAGYHVAVFD